MQGIRVPVTWLDPGSSLCLLFSLTISPAPPQGNLPATWLELWLTCYVSHLDLSLNALSVYLTPLQARKKRGGPGTEEGSCVGGRVGEAWGSCHHSEGKIKRTVQAMNEWAGPLSEGGRG